LSFFVGVASLIFEKWQKIKNFQVRMPIDWKLSNELSEDDIPHSDKYFCFGSQKTEFLCRKKGSNFFVSSLLKMLTILIIFRKICFLTNFLTFFFEKWQKMKNFQVRLPIDWNQLLFG